MDEAHEILLSSLKSSGVSLPVGVSSIKDSSSAALVSICAQSLRLILDSGPSSFPTSLPAATAERFKICAELAAAIKSLGYREELGFHQVVILYYILVIFIRVFEMIWQFLYPSDEESSQLIRNSSESENSGSNYKTNFCQEGTSSHDPSDGDKTSFMNLKENGLCNKSMFPWKVDVFVHKLTGIDSKEAVFFTIISLCL
ncbi:hypothetical protein M5K25_015225 [Dendrobium thyrsiflorum]|uniref:CCDC22 N-terminal domain-containing protein n=1 Tax=Dendrobium thyrsiflorum TaxID=117978 RepID=A0ABD0UQM8_DENTH